MKIYGISESFSRALEWKSRGGGADSMIRRNVCPALRATDYKCPKYVWLIEDEDDEVYQEQPIASGDAMQRI